jgi:hypothetical protein
VLAGLNSAEPANTITLVDHQGKKSELANAGIGESKLHALSILPEGLEKRLTLDEFVDLVGPLASEKRTPVR